MTSLQQVDNKDNLVSAQCQNNVTHEGSDINYGGYTLLTNDSVRPIIEVSIAPSIDRRSVQTKHPKSRATNPHLFSHQERRAC